MRASGAYPSETTGQGVRIAASVVSLWPVRRRRGLGRLGASGASVFEGRNERGAGREQAEGDERSEGSEGRPGEDSGGEDRVSAPLVHGHRGTPQELCGHAERDRGG